MKVVPIPHGGSGDGITSWVQWGTGCLIASDFSATQSRLCSNPNLTLGTMFHEYMRLWRQGDIEAAEEVRFVDLLCGYPPEVEIQEEAYRLFKHYCENEEFEKFGTILACEQHISGPDVESAVGVSPYAATIDLLAGTFTDCTLVDYKTAAKSGEKSYTKGKGKLQLHAYYLAAKSQGYNVTRIVIEQITKTKTPKVNTYDIDLPTPADISALRNFLQYAKHRRENGTRGVMLTACDSCDWYYSGHCLPGDQKHAITFPSKTKGT